MGPHNQLQSSIANLKTVQRDIAILVEVMLAIRNIAEGNSICGSALWRAPSLWRVPSLRRDPSDPSLERRIRAIQALSDLMHNFIPGDPTMLSAVRSQFEMQRERSPEAFELCPLLVHWATETDATEG